MRRLLAVVAIVSAAWTAVHAHQGAGAQTVSPAYPLRLSAERATALLDAIAQRRSYVPGEVLVKFKSGVTKQGRDRVVQSVSLSKTSDDLQWSGPVGLLVDASQPDSEAMAGALRQQPEVEFAEPNYLGQGGRLVPNDPDFQSRQWNLQKLEMIKSWDITNGGAPNIVVGIIDNGVTTVSQTFALPLWNGMAGAIQTVNVPVAVSPDMTTSRYVSPMDFAFWTGPVIDFQGHGTHVAGTVAQATNNGINLAGMAYNSSIMPVKVCFGFWDTQFMQSMLGLMGPTPFFEGTICPDSAVVSGIRYAVDHGANVLNISLVNFMSSAALRDAITYAVSKGVFVAMAMGNAYASDNRINYPSFYAAQLDGAMSVAAVGPTLAHASYSTTGSYCEIAAPGGDSNVGGAAGGIYQVTLDDSKFSAFSTAPRFDSYVEASFQGTSMSSPHVAGLAALLMSRGVTSPGDIEKIIKGSAKDLGQPGRDDVFGYGLIQPRAALFGLGIQR